MKRRGVYPYHFLFLITFLIGTLFHGIAAPACSGFTQDAEENPTDYDHIPNASVEVLPAYYSDSPADHTYIKAMRKNGSCTAWPCFGRDNGGVQLADTKSNIAEAAIPVIGALADTPPCKWPNHYYLIVGVCHQVANRGLYYTGKTVYKARMYKWSSHFYNTYGDCFWPLQKYCHVNCLDSAGQWPLPKTTQDPKAVKESPPHPEVAIYRKHLPEARQAKSRQAYQAFYQSYIDELLEYHIADRLGRDWSRKTSGVSFRYQRVGGWNKKGRAS